MHGENTEKCVSETFCDSNTQTVPVLLLWNLNERQCWILLGSLIISLSVCSHNSQHECRQLYLLLKFDVVSTRGFKHLFWFFYYNNLFSHQVSQRLHYITLFFSSSLQMNRWTQRRRRRGSSAGTGPPSTAASSKLWSECSRGRTTPTPSSGRTWPAGSTSLRPESRYEHAILLFQLVLLHFNFDPQICDDFIFLGSL